MKRKRRACRSGLTATSGTRRSTGAGVRRETSRARLVQMGIRSPQAFDPKSSKNSIIWSKEFIEKSLKSHWKVIENHWNSILYFIFPEISPYSQRIPRKIPNSKAFSLSLHRRCWARWGKVLWMNSSRKAVAKGWRLMRSQPWQSSWRRKKSYSKL